MNIDQLLDVIAKKIDNQDIRDLIQHHLFDLGNMFGDNQNHIIDLQTFVKFYIQRIEVKGLDSLIITTRLLLFYQELSLINQNRVCLKHITDYLIQSSEKAEIYFNLKFLPKNFRKTNRRSLIQSEIEPPEILGLNQDKLHRVQNELKTIDTKSKTQIIQAITNSYELFLLTQFQERIALFKEYQFEKYIILKKNETGNYIQQLSYGKNRLACITKNQNIYFFDKSDNYVFDFMIENQIDIINFTFLHLQEQWISISKQNQILLWNLETQNYNILTSQINQIGTFCEVIHLQMLLISSSPNLINCFDMFDQKLLFRFNTIHNVLSNMKYSLQFQLIFTIGVDNQIGCYQLHSLYNDYSLKCIFQGHSFTVTCIELITNTALLISIDCKNNLLLWDIRSQTLHQQIQLQTKLMVKQLFFYEKSLCLITTRLQTLQFEEFEDSLNLIKLIEIIYDEQNQRNIIVTRNDIRIQNCQSGKIQYILKDFIDEISAVCLIEHDNYLILGTAEGHLLKISIKDGEILQKWESIFNEEIFKLAYDSEAKLLHIINIDSSIKCLPLKQLNVRKDLLTQKDNRALRQVLHHIPIQLCTINLQHGLMISGSEGLITIWNLEYYQINIQIQLEDNNYATNIVFSKTKSYFAISTNQGIIYFIQIIKKNDHYICSIEGFIQIFTSQFITDLSEKPNVSQMIIEENNLFLGLTSGQIMKYDISQLNIPILQSVIQKTNYNPYRVIYHSNIKEYYIDNYKIINQFLVKEINLHNEKSPNQKIQQKFKSGIARLSAIRGMAGQYYDNNQQLLLTPIKIQQIHKEAIIQLTLIQIDSFEVLFQQKTSLIISASNDDTIKIITQDFDILCSFDINNPTPHFWNLQPQMHKLKASVLFSIELLKSILPSLNQQQQIAYNIDNILKECSIIHMKNKQIKNDKTQMLTVTNSLPDLIEKKNHTLRYYNEKIKQQKYHIEIQKQEKQIQDLTNKRNKFLQFQSQSNQRKEILDYLRTEEKVQEQDDFHKTIQNIRLKTEPKSMLQFSKITRTTNYTELSNRSISKFPHHSNEVFNLIKQAIDNPQKKSKKKDYLIQNSDLRIRLKSESNKKLF